MTDLDYKIVGIGITIILSALVSFITSYRTTKQELAKVPYEIQKNYADKLQQKRLEIYPQFYCLLSDLIKKLESRTIDKEYISQWLIKYLEVDTKNALLLSGVTANDNYRFFKQVEKVVDKYCIKNNELDEKFYSELKIANAHSVETNLKKDIGIYIVEFDPKIGKEVLNYYDIDKFHGGGK